MDIYSERIDIMKANGASEEEINRMQQYLTALNALNVTRKALGISDLIEKYKLYGNDIFIFA